MGTVYAGAMLMRYAIISIGLVFASVEAHRAAEVLNQVAAMLWRINNG